MASGYPDYQGDKSGVRDEAQFAEFEDNYKAVTGSGSGKTFGQAVTATYIVAAGKTFYTKAISCAIFADAAADGDKPQHFFLEVYSPTILVLQFRIGGSGGVVLSLDQPIKTEAGETFYMNMESYANHNVSMTLTARGYEL